MAPSSAFARAPARASAPPRNHAKKNQEALGKCLATSPGVRKIPTPMTDETTIIVASRSVRTRGNSWTLGDSEAKPPETLPEFAAASSTVRDREAPTFVRKNHEPQRPENPERARQRGGPRRS